MNPRAYRLRTDSRLTEEAPKPGWNAVSLKGRSTIHGFSWQVQAAFWVPLGEATCSVLEKPRSFRSVGYGVWRSPRWLIQVCLDSSRCLTLKCKR